MEVEVRADGWRVAVEIGPEVDIWQVLKAAAEAIRGLPGGSSYSPTYGAIKTTSPRPGTKTARIREIARQILADGHVHERREIAKAVREAGLDPQPLTKILDELFERGTNMDGRPTYRDTSVPSPYVDPRSVPDDEKPPWLRDHPPAHEAGDLERIDAANGTP